MKKNVKKLLSVVLSVIMLLGVIPFAASAETVASGVRITSFYVLSKPTLLQPSFFVLFYTVFAFLYHILFYPKRKSVTSITQKPMMRA